MNITRSARTSARGRLRTIVLIWESARALRMSHRSCQHQPTLEMRLSHFYIYFSHSLPWLVDDNNEGDSMRIAREFWLSFFIFLLNLLLTQFVMAAEQVQPSKVDDRATFLDGEWTGTGSFFLGEDYGNQITGCSEVKLSYVGTKTKYEVHGGSAVCNGKFNPFNEEAKFGIKEDGTIFYVISKEHTLIPDTIVGSVSNGILHTQTPHGNSIDDVTIMRKGDILIFRQCDAASEGNPAYAFTAILTQDPSLIKK